MFFQSLELLIGVDQSRTLDYTDISPYNLLEDLTVNVKISPLLCGFIWKFRRIIAQAGIL
jgi:hypothetical protein